MSKTKRRRDREKERQRDRGTEGQRDRETERQGDGGTAEMERRFPLSLRLSFPLSLRLRGGESLSSRFQRLQARGHILRQFGRREAGGDLSYFTVGELSVAGLVGDDVSPHPGQEGQRHIHYQIGVFDVGDELQPQRLKVGQLEQFIFEQFRFEVDRLRADENGPGGADQFNRVGFGRRRSAFGDGQRQLIGLIAFNKGQRPLLGAGAQFAPGLRDRKSTRLNSSHLGISYAVFCFLSSPVIYSLSLHDALPIF